MYSRLLNITVKPFIAATLLASSAQADGLPFIGAELETDEAGVHEPVAQLITSDTLDLADSSYKLYEHIAGGGEYEVRDPLSFQCSAPDVFALEDAATA